MTPMQQLAVIAVVVFIVGVGAIVWFFRDRRRQDIEESWALFGLGLVAVAMSICWAIPPVVTAWDSVHR